MLLQSNSSSTLDFVSITVGIPTILSGRRPNKNEKEKGSNRGDSRRRTPDRDGTRPHGDSTKQYKLCASVGTRLIGWSVSELKGV